MSTPDNINMFYSMLPNIMGQLTLVANTRMSSLAASSFASDQASSVFCLYSWIFSFLVSHSFWRFSTFQNGIKTRMKNYLKNIFQWKK